VSPLFFLLTNVATENISSSNETSAMVDRIPSGVLVSKSLTVKGLLLFHFAKYHKEAFESLLADFESGRLKVPVDLIRGKGVSSVLSHTQALYKPSFYSWRQFMRELITSM
jgi:NADPH-dependent curcumin reductase CurA